MSTVDLATSTSNADDPKTMARELVEGITGSEPKLAIVFAAGDSEHTTVAAALRDALPSGTRLAYVTSGAPIGPGGSCPGTSVLAALSGDLEVGLGMGGDLSADPLTAGSAAAKAAAAELGSALDDIDTRTTAGIVVDDGMRMKKEEALLGILDVNPGISLVGGGATDGKPMGGGPPEAVVGIDGEVDGDAVLLMLLKTNAKWAAMRHHAYEPTGERMTITKVGEPSTQVLEIDGKPAVEAYATLLGVGVDELEFGKPKGFSDRPTAMRVGREYFMRAPWQPMDDGSILFSNRMLEDNILELMKLVDTVPALRKFLNDEVPARVGEPTGALYFNCYGRFLLEQGMDINGEVNATYAEGPPAAGMNAAFEIFNGFQVNSTLTTLAFGKGA